MTVFKASLRDKYIGLVMNQLLHHDLLLMLFYLYLS